MNQARELERRRAIARRLSDFMLQFAEEESLSLEDLGLDQARSCGSRRFLAYYSPDGVEYALKAYGVYAELDRRGFERISLQLDTSDPYVHRLSLYDVGEPEALLHEIVVRRRQLSFAAGSAFEQQRFQFLGIDWIILQNPRAAFSPGQPRLPGQQHPGLGLGRLVMDVIQLSAERLELDGLLAVPAWFHSAVLYHQRFSCFDPVCEGRLQAMMRDLLGHHSLSEISWAVEQARVSENGQAFSWFHAEQVLPLNPRLKAYFQSNRYTAAVAASAQSHHYRLEALPFGSGPNPAQDPA